MKINKIPFSQREKQAIEQCDHLIKDFANRATRNKLRYKRLQFISVSLAVIATILSALLASDNLGVIDWVVPLVSGLSVLATTLMSQTNSQKMWVSSRSISQKFESERFLYTQKSGEYGTIRDEEKRLALFSNRIMEVWSQAQDTWEQSVPTMK